MRVLGERGRRPARGPSSRVVSCSESVRFAGLVHDVTSCPGLGRDVPGGRTGTAPVIMWEPHPLRATSSDDRAAFLVWPNGPCRAPGRPASAAHPASGTAVPRRHVPRCARLLGSTAHAAGRTAPSDRAAPTRRSRRAALREPEPARSAKPLNSTPAATVSRTIRIVLLESVTPPDGRQAGVSVRYRCCQSSYSSARTSSGTTPASFASSPTVRTPSTTLSSVNSSSDTLVTGAPA